MMVFELPLRSHIVVFLVVEEVYIAFRLGLPVICWDRIRVGIVFADTVVNPGNPSRAFIPRPMLKAISFHKHLC